MIDIKTATTAELVAFYNEHAAKPVKKFADRKTAERRVGELVEKLEARRAAAMEELEAYAQRQEERCAVPELGIDECPCCGVHLSNGYTTNTAQRHDNLPLLEKREYMCLGCGEEFGPLIKGRSEKRAAGIAASWNDAEVAAKRSQRSAVEVDGNTYRSVRQAFAQLNLPMKEHITFRMLLKQHGQLNEYGYSWKIVPLNY